jgi:uncharacterized caspase-like protein
MRILNIGVEQVGFTTDANHALVARGRDVVTGWRIAFLVPAGHGDRVLSDVHAGRRPIVAVPEVDAMPWTPVTAVEWE